MEHSQIGKQIGKLLDMPKKEKYHKDAHTKSVHDGCDTFPNELTGFRFEAKPIWEKIQKHCKSAVIF